MKTKRSIVAIGIPILLMLAVWGAFRIWQAKGSSDIAVTATVLSEDESGQTERQRIQPKAAAEVLLGNSAQARQAVFDNGILHTGFEHGPVEIKGVIPADSIRNACLQSAVTEDWPFSIVFYNTSSGRAFHIYLDVEYNTIEGTAKADLYIFEDPYAAPVVAHWEGQPGERIAVSPDGMEI